KPKVKSSHSHASPVYVNSVIIASIFETLFGRGAPKKKLPEWFIFLPNPLLAEFIKGFWYGDGNITNDGFEFNTTSKILAHQVWMILIKLGVIPSLCIHKVDKERIRYASGRKFTYKSDIYRINITGTSLLEMSKILNIKHPFITKRGRTYHRGKITGKFLWMPIVSISRERYKGIVCNLKTESGTYSLSGLIAHNCTADIAWITGHTYTCYGPLLNGATMLIYEGAPDFPKPDRWCEIIEKYGVTIFYTAPTAIRMFIKYDGKWVRKHDLSSLRILASVGEPINKEAWLWYFNEVGGGRCPIIDTWWQTETGGTLINSLPGIGPFIPTVAGRSFPGTRHEVLDDEGKVLPPGKEGNLVQLSPFAPGMLKGIYKNPKKYIETYWKKYGNKYFTSDGAWKDEKGNFRLTGRLDDVMKVAGHRLATAELEDAITTHPSVAECAVVPMPHGIKGEVPIAFVILKGKPYKQIKGELIKQVEKSIGPIARPSKIFFIEDLPRTRSGKIIRRLLKRLLRNEKLGDISTLANPECVNKIKQILHKD
ncbi:MAG: AMP-binding protein, partial [Methanosarcinales archaeon]